jgi:hypothetical protein
MASSIRSAFRVPSTAASVTPRADQSTVMMEAVYSAVRAGGCGRPSADSARARTRRDGAAARPEGCFQMLYAL